MGWGKGWRWHRSPYISPSFEEMPPIVRSPPHLPENHWVVPISMLGYKQQNASSKFKEKRKL